MKTRKLGDLEVSAIGYGCMGLSHAYGFALDKKEAIKCIQTAFDKGCNFFDTAEVYTGKFTDGTTAINEEIVGEALKDIRDRVIIATKGGIFFKDNDTVVPNASENSIRTSVEKSLKLLKTDVIDLYYQHRIDPNISPEDVAYTMNKLIQEGKIKHWGISNINEDYIRRANKICKVTAVQERYSMMARWNEKFFPLLEELNIGFVAYSPLANGFLSGNFLNATEYNKDLDRRSKMPQYQQEGIEKAKDLLDFLNKISKEKNITPAQISLAWMICKKDYIVPIPGSTKLHRIEENLQANNLLLTSEEISKIDGMLDTMTFDVFGGVNVIKA